MARSTAKRRKATGTRQASPPQPRAGDPTDQALLHGNYVRIQAERAETHRGAAMVWCNTHAWAIDRYKRRGWLSDRQHDAVTRYRNDYDKSGYERSVIGNYSGFGGSGSASPNYGGLLAANNAQLDARRRLQDARGTLPARLVHSFDAMVLHEDDAQMVGELAGRSGTMAARFAIEWLRICCDVLSDFYRLPGA